MDARKGWYMLLLRNPESKFGQAGSHKIQPLPFISSKTSNYFVIAGNVFFRFQIGGCESGMRQ